MNYKEVQAIRARYPAVLTPEQQEEILNQIPIEEESLAHLGFNLNERPYEKTEIELFWKYEIRHAAVRAKNCMERVAGKKLDPGLHRVEGLLLYTLVEQCLNSEDRTTKFKERKVWAEGIFNAWKNAVSKEMFKMQLVGVQNHLDIHDSVYQKYHKNEPDHLSIFIKNLIDKARENA